MPNYYKRNWISSWEFRRRPPFNILNQIQNLPKEILNRIVVLIRNYNGINAKNFVDFLINNNLVQGNVDLFFGAFDGTPLNRELVNLPKLLQYYYDAGYRMFIVAYSSGLLLEAFDWIRSHNDVIVFNTTSSVSTNVFINTIPRNLIRTNLPDNELLDILMKDMLSNFYNLLQSSGYYSLAIPLSNTQQGKFPFNKLVYIYETSVYSDGYLVNLKKLLTSEGTTEMFKDVELIEILLDGDELPELAKYYLTYNNISSKGYIDSTDKPLIIFNSPDAYSLLKYLDDPRYYDNYVLFGDPFSVKFNTPYKFRAAFIPVANFSDIGYRLSYYVDKTQSINPQILNIYNVISQSGSIFTGLAEKNKYKFDVDEFLDILSKYNIITNSQWSEKYITFYSYEGVSLDDGTYDNSWKIVLMKHQWNPDTVVLVKAADTILNYSQLEMGDNIVAYEENVKRINDNKPEIDMLLDEYSQLFLTVDELVLYQDFLKKNFKNKLEAYQYTQYYVYDNVLEYSIPLIKLDSINVSIPILKSQYVLSLTDDTYNELIVPLIIPEIEYDTKEYFYDIVTNSQIDFLTDNYSNEKYELINTTLTDSTTNIVLHLYRGHIMRIGTYNSDTDVFTTTETIRGYVEQNITITWLIIETEYNVGDRVVVRETSKMGTVVSVSENKYEINVVIDDESSGEITYNQTEVIKFLDI